MDWELTAIKAGTTLAEALNKINDDGCQIALVIDEDKRLMGIIADSDIRKGMLKGVTLKDKVEKVMNKKPIVVGTELNGLDASKLMKMNKIFHLPVINESGIVKGLHLADQLRTNNKRKERIIIMAGGKGKRLLPLTETIPKPMLPIHSKPILEHILEKIKDEGFENITISINYLGNKIKE